MTPDEQAVFDHIRAEYEKLVKAGDQVRAVPIDGALAAKLRMTPERLGAAAERLWNAGRIRRVTDDRYTL